MSETNVSFVSKVRVGRWSKCKQWRVNLYCLGMILQWYQHHWYFTHTFIIVCMRSHTHTQTNNSLFVSVFPAFQSHTYSFTFNMCECLDSHDHTLPIAISEEYYLFWAISFSFSLFFFTFICSCSPPSVPFSPHFHLSSVILSLLFPHLDEQVYSGFRWETNHQAAAALNNSTSN